ncbi:MAG TPA: YIP1 family protein [Terriglobales bacterium]|nr:YIP1 family protein [Terriglobales bacterium]
MSTPSTSPVPENHAPELSQPALSEPQRLVNTFVAPSRTFLDIRRNASWWVPLVVMSVVSIGFLLTVEKKVGWDQVAHNMMASNSRIQQLPADQQERIINTTATGLKFSIYLSPIFLLLYAAITTVVLWASFNFGMDAQIEFSRAMAIVLYGWLPAIVGSILGIITLGFGNPEGFLLENPVGTNPAYFLDFNTTSKLVYVMLSSLDVIVLWCAVLMGIGFALNAKKKISTGAGVSMVLGWYLVYKLIGASWAAMRG